MLALFMPYQTLITHDCPGSFRKYALAWLILWSMWSPLRVSALSSEPVALDQGYMLLAQARMMLPGSAQEQLLWAAVKAFRRSSQKSEVRSQVQALIGTAQSYMAMQTPIRRFPYLWSTSPLQQAERELQQALQLEPGNAAATLLLGIVSWRQALAFPAQREDYVTRSAMLLNRVAALGLPVRVPAMDVALTRDAIPAFGVQDALIVLQAVDARGTGHLEDWLLAYCLRESEHGCFSMVFSAGTAYPLIADPATGAVVPLNTSLEGLTIEPSPRGRPIIVVHGRQEQHPFAAQFAWEGDHFALLDTDIQPR